MNTYRSRLIFPTLCTCLGTWQLYRLQWKTKLLKDIQEGLEKEPVAIDVINGAPDKAYRRLQLDGFTLDDEIVLVGPRSSRDLLPDSKFGFILVRKIKDKQGNSYLLNDGWIPWKAAPAEFKPSDLGKEQFVLDRSESPSIFAKSNSPEEGIWRWKNVSQLAEALETRPAMVKRITGNTNGRVAVPSPATFEIPNRHLEYVFTWYGVAAATFLLSFVRR